MTNPDRKRLHYFWAYVDGHRVADSYTFELYDDGTYSHSWDQEADHCGANKAAWVGTWRRDGETFVLDDGKIVLVRQKDGSVIWDDIRLEDHTNR